jgi:hypothetical protein
MKFAGSSIFNTGAGHNALVEVKLNFISKMKWRRKKPKKLFSASGDKELLIARDCPSPLNISDFDGQCIHVDT